MSNKEANPSNSTSAPPVSVAQQSGHNAPPYLPNNQYQSPIPQGVYLNQQPWFSNWQHQPPDQLQYLKSTNYATQPPGYNAALYQPPNQVQFGQQPQPVMYQGSFVFANPQNTMINPSTIHDYLAWSIINMFVGGIILGLLPLIFSISCRDSKRLNDVAQAQSKSKAALISNIVVSLIGIALWITLIVLLVQASYYL